MSCSTKMWRGPGSLRGQHRVLEAPCSVPGGGGGVKPFAAGLQGGLERTASRRGRGNKQHPPTCLGQCLVTYCSGIISRSEWLARTSSCQVPCPPASARSA